MLSAIAQNPENELELQVRIASSKPTLGYRMRQMRPIGTAPKKGFGFAERGAQDIGADVFLWRRTTRNDDYKLAK